MARHTGKDGLVKFGVNTVAALDSFDVEEQIGEQDLTAAGDTWRSHGTTYKEWSGTVTLKADWAGTGQTARAGDEVAFEGYTEGDGSGKVYLSGTATITGHSVSSPHDGAVTRTYTLKGTGELSIETVA